jgi:hypothetical protein
MFSNKNMIKIQDVRNAINTKLWTLTWENKVFVQASNFFTQKATGFPFVMFEPSEMSSVYEDTANNYRNFIFQIVIVQEMTHVTRGQAMDILLNCFEQMIDAFDQDRTLWWVVQQVDATNGEFGEIDMEKWPCLYLSSNLNCRVLVPIV